MSKSFDVVGFGICTVDFLGLVANYPTADQKVRMLDFSKQGGGLTGTALAAAGRLGARTAYFGKLGTDEYSLFLLHEFKKYKVDVSQTKIDERVQPPLSFIHVEKETGERRITWHWNEFDLRSEEVDRESIQHSRILFLDHFHTEAGVLAADWIHESGGMVVCDAERMTAGFEHVLQRADYIISSRKFAEAQSGLHDPLQSARSLHEKFGGTVVVTAGDSGAYCKSSETEFHQTAFGVEVVDTTGAGDVFHGAFMAGLAKNWTLPKILEFSAAVSAMKCRSLGGRAGIPTMNEVEVFLNEKGAANF
jgi:sugar/nucleoside kinase (ribokinase family)